MVPSFLKDGSHYLYWKLGTWKLVPELIVLDVGQSILIFSQRTSVFVLISGF